MAGHSKWAKVKRMKAVVDARRGKIDTSAAGNQLIEALEEHDNVKEVFFNAERGQV